VVICSCKFEIIFSIFAFATKLIEIEIPEGERMSNVPEYRISAYSIALVSTLVDKMEKWNINYFIEFLSQYIPIPIGNRCAM
jgi:hypothetical protein